MLARISEGSSDCESFDGKLMQLGEGTFMISQFYHQDGDLYMGHEEPGIRTKCKIMYLHRVFDVIGFVYPDYYYPSAPRARSEESGRAIEGPDLAYNSLKKDKILFSLKKLAEMNENFEVAKAKQEISEMERLMIANEED
ncbi:hypothetical protein ACJX0J_037126 [Zea mays]